jgi:hypothetical protein
LPACAKGLELRVPLGNTAGVIRTERAMRRLASILGVLGLLLGVAPPAAAQGGFTPVDTALVLVVDASGSITEEEFRLQREGIALAVTDPGVMSAILSGGLQRIAIAYVEWGGPMMAQTMVGWMIVEDGASADDFAAAVLAAPRSQQSYNAIGDAIDHAAALLGQCPCQPTRRVIDVSGDNPDNRSVRPAPVARDAAIAAGITVNALAILENDPIGPSGRPLLVENYEGEVIGGPGAFVLPAQDRRDFTRALRQKMVLEIAGLQPAPALLEGQPAGQPGSSG